MGSPTTSPCLAQLTGTIFAVSKTPTRLVTSSTTAYSLENPFDVTITFSATLTANREGLGDQTITFAPIDGSAPIEGSPYCTGTTNSSGVASCQVSELLALARANPKYIATFGGNSAYVASVANGSIP